MFNRNDPKRKAFNAKASRMSEIAVDHKLAEIPFGKNYTPVLGSSIFSSLAEGTTTAHIMAIRGMTADTYLVRSTSPEYVDMSNHTLTGHSNPVAKILDPYELGPNPFIPELMLPKSKVASSLGLNCLNVVYTSRNISLSKAKIMVSAYGKEGSFIVVAFQVRDVLKVGGKIYLDTSSALENALVVAIPLGERIKFRIL